ncbi:protein tyrosine phosphatase family protein [Oscillatoriales cyanobacterium LEGE 11467]|uniref:Protein tyrosine phosphatase family protein n=1 Tax=Zarconia navalis LEGE 11467 TaxID=1828826 RepID=A0A928VXJ7_9CYAN|nr:protein tyrosine phosphatase family protein [Zarconia navalis]MBE9042124.1 protein tyrosine phosphatase family protein [Zarconia navalis LEGE 11467]
MQDIENYYQVSPQLATSGQPSRSQFQEIADAGYTAVINLAMPTSDNAIADEGAIVTETGMAYFHIPVVWEAPKLEEVRLFFGMMQSLENRKIWVHCAKNMRVSCFVYLWQKYVLNLPESDARYPMNQIWQPEGVWEKLLGDAEKKFG